MLSATRSTSRTRASNSALAADQLMCTVGGRGVCAQMLLSVRARSSGRCALEQWLAIQQTRCSWAEPGLRGSCAALRVAVAVGRLTSEDAAARALVDRRHADRQRPQRATCMTVAGQLALA